MPRRRAAVERDDLPNTKISEALIAFVEPVFERFPPRGLKDVENGFMFAVMAWNAVIFEDAGQAKPLEDVRRALRAAYPREEFPIALFESLVDRKRLAFAHDRRAIGECNVRLDERGINVQATGHLSPPRQGSPTWLPLLGHDRLAKFEGL